MKVKSNLINNTELKKKRLATMTTPDIFKGTGELYESELGAQMDEGKMFSNIASGSRFVLHPVTTEYVERQLSQLKTNEAVGLDKISARLLQDSAKIVAPALQHIANLSFDLQHGNAPK